MDAIKFIKEEIRMCAEADGCIDCPLCNTDYCSASPKKRPQEEAEKIVRLVEEWATIHPRRTRQDVFLEQYPEASTDDTGTLLILPCTLISSLKRSSYCGGRENCIGCRREFWTQEVK